MSHCAQNESVGRSSCRCLKGFGHKSPLADEFHAAQQEYHVKRYSHFNESRSKAKFAESLDQVLKKFLKNEWLMLYPLANASDHEGKEQSENSVTHP